MQRNTVHVPAPRRCTGTATTCSVSHEADRSALEFKPSSRSAAKDVRCAIASRSPSGPVNEHAAQENCGAGCDEEFCYAGRLLRTRGQRGEIDVGPTQHYRCGTTSQVSAILQQAGNRDRRCAFDQDMMLIDDRSQAAANLVLRHRDEIVNQCPAQAESDSIRIETARGAVGQSRFAGKLEDPTGTNGLAHDA